MILSRARARWGKPGRGTDAEPDHAGEVDLPVDRLRLGRRDWTTVASSARVGPPAAVNDRAARSNTGISLIRTSLSQCWQPRLDRWSLF
jgi:hypothetical protein